MKNEPLTEPNQTHTAEQLQIGSATLYRKLKSYGLIGGKHAVRNGPERGASGPNVTRQS